MAFDYQNSQKTALGLIQNFGFKTTLGRIYSDYDPVSGEMISNSIAKGDIDVVTLPATNGTISGFDDRFVSDWRAGNVRFFYVNASTAIFPPEPGDMILHEDALWDIAGSTKLSPAGTDIYYTVGCRRSQKPLSTLDLPEVQPCAGFNLVTDDW